MTEQHIGILYPGEMGISIAASAQNSGHRVCWASERRSAATHERARKFELRDTRTLQALCSECAVIISVCPPHAAETLAQDVVAAGFQGLYVDANAISPQRAVLIGQLMAGAGIGFVDGGIIGMPAWKPAATWLYLSGARAAEAAACFSAGPLETELLGTAIGEASALKMCFAAHTKGMAALLCAILGTAEALGVREALHRQWTRSDPVLAENVSRRVRDAAPKAWRFAGEMEEISRTFSEAGLPGEFHAAAAEIYRRLARFKDSRNLPSLEEMLAALLDRPPNRAGMTGN